MAKKPSKFKLTFLDKDKDTVTIEATDISFSDPTFIRFYLGEYSDSQFVAAYPKHDVHAVVRL